MSLRKKKDLVLSFVATFLPLVTHMPVITRKSLTLVFFKLVGLHSNERTNELYIFLFYVRPSYRRRHRSVVLVKTERSTNLTRSSYAFVEFRSTRDAEDAYYDMYVQPVFFFTRLISSRHGKHFEGYRLSIQVCVLTCPTPSHLNDMIVG